MADLAKESMTMVVVTHEMSFSQDAADEIVFLDHGRVVEVSTPEKFFRQAETEQARQFFQRYGSPQRRSARAREETAT